MVIFKGSNFRKFLIPAVAVVIILGSFAGIASADQPAVKSNNGNSGENPNFMNGRQQTLEPGNDPVITTPTREVVDASVKTGRAAIYVGTADQSDISYRINSPVMTSVSVKLIWYGSWANNGNTTPSSNNYQGFTEKFLQDLSTQPRWTINNSYYQKISSAQNYVPTTITASSISVSRNKSKYREPLSQSTINQIAMDTIKGSAVNASTIYVVLTSSDIKVNGFGTSFCGWHSYNSNTKMKYSFVGDPANISGCIAQSTSPNLAGADAMLSVLVHEIEETATDPQLNAWYSANGAENSDKCAWTWGNWYQVSNGSYANLNLSGVNYLIQQGFKLSGTGPKSTTSGVDTWSGTCANG